MEKAMLPKSSASKCRHRRIPDAPRITAANAPSASLPLRFIVTGILALVLSTIVIGLGTWLQGRTAGAQ